MMQYWRVIGSPSRAVARGGFWFETCGDWTFYSPHVAWETSAWFSSVPFLSVG
jgi:hypothetical protein